jgi:DUF1009 family protein
MLCAIIDARTFLEDNLATVGLITRKRSRINGKSLQLGISTPKEMARLNIGQSVIVQKGTIVAVEDFAGTDDLISRVGRYNLKDEIFIKTTKYNQDFRFDVPVFGMQALANLNDANLKYATLEAQNVRILDKEKVLAKAERYGIEIIGFQWTQLGNIY